MPSSSDRSFSQGDDKINTIESLFQQQAQSSTAAKGTAKSSKHGKKKNSNLGATRIYPSERTKASTLDFANHFENSSGAPFLTPENDETALASLQRQNSATMIGADDAEYSKWNDLFAHDPKVTEDSEGKPDLDVAKGNNLDVIKSSIGGQDSMAVLPSKVPLSPGSSKHHSKSPVSPKAIPSFISPPLASPPTKYRRSSMASQYAARQPFFSQPNSTFRSQTPLPHYPQAHFYSPPQVNIPVPPSSSVPVPVAGDCGYFCGFDSLASTGGPDSLPAEDVVLIGWEGGLDIYKVTKESMDLIGRLSDLRGSVVDAKIIPMSSEPDSAPPICPLVALIVNGPSLSKVDTLTGGMEEADDQVSGAPSRRSSGKAASLLDDENNVLDSPDHYETTVEIYSISNNQHISTLLTTTTTTETPLAVPPSSPLFDRPQSSGHLSLQTSERYIIVSSGESGEVFIFQSDISTIDDTHKVPFPCIGKVWTTISSQPQQNHSKSPSASRLNQSSSPELYQDHYPIGKPMVSLKQRWLAFSPATPSRPFIGATAQTELSHSRVPGLISHRAPPQPQITCALEVPEGDGVMKWVAREVTQEVIKSAKWVGGKAIQTFNSFWNPTFPQDSHISHVQGSAVGDGGYNNTQQFPPTHAPTITRSQNDREPSLISIIDLEKLAKTHSPPSVPPIPVATFPALQGCSFLSFATDGLHLLVTSAKGDNHLVWDLMRLVNGRSREATSQGILSNPKPRVRQIAIFHRMTPSITVDVVWSESVASRFAVVTDKGTVHVHDLPEYALQWPPRRRTTRSRSGPQEESKIIDPSETSISASGAATTAVNAVSAAFKMVNNTAQPIITAAQRRGNDNVFGPQPAAGYSASTFNRKPSGHAVAQGLSKSLGAATGTVNSIRNVNENLLRIPISGNSIRGGCVHWLGSAQLPQIAVVGGGFLRIHGVGSRLLDERGSKKRVTVAKSTTQFALPKLPDFKVAPVFTANLSLGAVESPQAFWASPSVKTVAHMEEPHLLSQAELDTNPPYQPFHADRRVNMYVYNSGLQDAGPATDSLRAQPDGGDVINDMTAWAFGEDISVTKLDFGFHQDLGSPRKDALITATENSHIATADDEVLEQIVLTTRRTRRGRRKESDQLDSNNEDGFFEEDCEILDFVNDKGWER